jgi:hypothetical protein
MACGQALSRRGRGLKHIFFLEFFLATFFVSRQKKLLGFRGKAPDNCIKVSRMDETKDQF